MSQSDNRAFYDEAALADRVFPLLRSSAPESSFFHVLKPGFYCPHPNITGKSQNEQQGHLGPDHRPQAPGPDRNPTRQPRGPLLAHAEGADPQASRSVGHALLWLLWRLHVLPQYFADVPQTDIYFSTFAVALANVPGNVVSAVMVDRVGRTRTLGTCTGLLYYALVYFPLHKQRPPPLPRVM